MEPKSNYIIQVLSFIGGVLTTLFFVGFLLMTTILRTQTSFFIIGILFIIAALAVNRLLDKPFLNALNITCYIAGFVLITYSLFSDAHLLFIVQAAVCLSTIIIARGFVLPLLATITGYISLCVEMHHLFISTHALTITIPLIMMLFLIMNVFEAKVYHLLKVDVIKYHAIHTGIFVSCIISLAALSTNYLTVDLDNRIISVFIGVGILIMAYKIMQVMSVKKTFHKICFYLLGLIVCIFTSHAPYLAGTILLILICFNYGYSTGCGMALLFFIYTISKYYYDLNSTLLIKSITLFGIGIIFLIAWYLFTRKKIKHEKI